MDKASVPVLESGRVQAAYQKIAGFYSAYSLASARKYLSGALRAAAGNLAWKASPSNALFFFEHLNALTRAALVIHDSGFTRQAAILSPAEQVPDLTQYGRYCGWQSSGLPRHFVPRSLSPKEYANPYKVFHKLAVYGPYKVWKETLHTILHYSLCHYSLIECGENYNVLELWFLLSKLLEAAHLIEVRAIDETSGRHRPEWKGVGHHAPETGSPGSKQENTNEQIGGDRLE